MNYAFLTTLIPKQMEQEIRERSRYNMQDAANALQWNIYEGLSANLLEEVRLFNVLPIGSFPQYYSKAFIKASVFEAGEYEKHVNIGFCNVKLLRKYHQPSKIYKALKKWCANDHEEKNLFVYTVSAPFMTAVARLKEDYPNLRVCAIIADLPDMSSLSTNKSLIQQMFEKKQAAASYSRLACVDSFVLLTRQMADYLKITKPFVVMEGISTAMESVVVPKDDGLKRIFYGGTLHKRFGVLNLVEAFRQIEDANYRLIICGVGDGVSEIRRAASSDSRIEFMGQLPREEVLLLQRQATVLVNPRQNNEEFTKYSFPSKTMEYLASGVPVVAYKLDGIPDEYDQYLNYVTDNSAESLAAKLMQICNMDEELRREMGRKGAEFVQQNKNAIIQSRRILEFIRVL